MSDIVEAVAKAISPGLFDENDAAVDGNLASQVRFEMQESARSRARRALAALEAKGWVVARRGPTINGRAFIASRKSGVFPRSEVERENNVVYEDCVYFDTQEQYNEWIKTPEGAAWRARRFSPKDTA